MVANELFSFLLLLLFCFVFLFFFFSLFFFLSVFVVVVVLLIEEMLLQGQKKMVKKCCYWQRNRDLVSLMESFAAQQYKLNNHWELIRFRLLSFVCIFLCFCWKLMNILTEPMRMGWTDYVYITCESVSGGTCGEEQPAQKLSSFPLLLRI